MKKRIEAAGTVMEFGGQVLMLCRDLKKAHGGEWGFPGGKVEGNESPSVAVARELFQETGYVAVPSELEFVDTFIFEFPEHITNYHAFRIVLKGEVAVKINNAEHSEFLWLSPKDCHNKPGAMLGVKEIIEKIYSQF